MTNIAALKAKMFPYSLPGEVLELLLEEQGLQAPDDYNNDTDRINLLKAAVSGLYQVITLKEESDGGSTVKYDIGKIEKLIKRYSNEAGIEDDSKPINRDKTQYW